jgi:hypothetical protein
MKFFALLDWSKSFCGGIPRSSIMQDNWSPAIYKKKLYIFPLFVNFITNTEGIIPKKTAGRDFSHQKMFLKIAMTTT